MPTRWTKTTKYADFLIKNQQFISKIIMVTNSPSLKAKRTCSLQSSACSACRETWHYVTQYEIKLQLWTPLSNQIHKSSRALFVLIFKYTCHRKSVTAHNTIILLSLLLLLLYKDSEITYYIRFINWNTNIFCFKFLYLKHKTIGIKQNGG